MENIDCNLCGGTDYSAYETVTDLLLERFDVQAELVQCANCSLVYQNPRPTLAEIGEHYPSNYDSYADHTQDKKRNWLLQLAIDYGFRKRRRFVTQHKQSGSLLDIGCAAGTFILSMRETQKWEVQGVEISEDVAAMARERYGLDVFAGSLEEANFDSEQFDVVTMWDVFEHLHDPSTTLSEVGRILKPDGLLLIRIPNLACWDVSVFGKYWAGFDAPRHLYIFTPQTVERILSKAGFSIIDRSCSSASYMTFVLSVRFWLTARGASTRTRTTLLNILYHPILRVLSAPLFYLPNIGLRGPLLITIAKRNL